MALKLNKSKTVSKEAAEKAEAGGGLSFLKRGKAAQEAMAKEEHRIEQASKSKVFRFWIPNDTDTEITFLDGDLDDGILDIPFLYEHNINMNGKWGNFFICTQDEEPCPICEGGNNPSYVGLLTVIDHSEYVSKRDGKTYKDNVKLFVAKRETIKQLQKLAAKRDGLRGVRFDVSRTGDKSASVGNIFDFTEKYSEAQLKKMFPESHEPLDYEELLGEQYMTAKELRKLGFGSSAGPIGSEDAPWEGGGDFEDEL